MVDNIAPKVFVSHAGEDRDRFVTGFATKLMEKGVDAWYSLWEIAPGDSLVEKIFNEGLKDAAALIIVLLMCTRFFGPLPELAS